VNEVNICFSGGAQGSDLLWGELALAHGHELIHYVFKGHKGSKHPNAVMVNPDQLKVGDSVLKKVNDVLGRSFPAHSEFVTNLLRRNFWQVRDTDSVYALAGIDDDGLVRGGTSWAVECFKILKPNSNQIYVFDTEIDFWFQWHPSTFEIPSVWKMIERPPTPKGKWTGIGTRPEGLTKKAEEAARSLFE
jgi:hypothetical protein